jgi:hypothetical protein
MIPGRRNYREGQVPSGRNPRLDPSGVPCSNAALDTGPGLKVQEVLMMLRGLAIFAVLAVVFLVFAPGCSGSSSAESDLAVGADTVSPPDAGDLADAAFADSADVPPADIRNMRYCEILLVTMGDTLVHVEVYNTFGINDCPQDLWSKVDATQVATDAGVTLAALNGPRYWLMDAFEVGSFVDPTPRTLGGLEMRHGGSIDVPLADLATLGKTPYTGTTVERNSKVRFDAGKSVYELVGPDGRIYDMQSYSVQKVAQTEADLVTLGSRLTLPKGWMYRTRTLTAPLEITAIGGFATIIQDDFANSYQLSGQ